MLTLPTHHSWTFHFKYKVSVSFGNFIKIQIYTSFNPLHQYNYDKIVNTIGIQYMKLYTTDLFSMENGKFCVISILTQTLKNLRSAQLIIFLSDIPVAFIMLFLIVCITKPYVEDLYWDLGVEIKVQTSKTPIPIGLLWSVKRTNFWQYDQFVTYKMNHLQSAYEEGKVMCGFVMKC